jgi:hypothetical protein
MALTKITGEGVGAVDNLTVDTNTLHVDAANNRVGINTTSMDAALQVQNGDITVGWADNFIGSQFSDGSDFRLGMKFGTVNRTTKIVAETNDNNGEITFETNGSERARVTNNGITFNGDTAAANALDDYEEGTWTPSSGVGSAPSNSGHYTKIGREVTVYGDCTFSGGGGANIEINGLPFTVASSPQTAGCVGFNTIQTDLSLICIPSTTSMNLYNGSSAGVNIASGKRIIFTAIYVV